MSNTRRSWSYRQNKRYNSNFRNRKIRKQVKKYWKQAATKEGWLPF